MTEAPLPAGRASPRAPYTAEQRAALITASLAAFLTPFMGASTNVALPSIAREFHLDAVALGWIPTSFLLAAATCLVPFGRLADIRGRKRVLVAGIATYTLGSLFSALSPSGAWLIAARAVQGVGGAMMFGTGVAVLTSVMPAERRGAALGVNVASVYLGLSLGPVVGGWLTESLGWRSLFHVNAALGTVTVAVALMYLRGEWAEAKGERFDAAGSLLYAAALSALMYGLSRLPARDGAWWIAAGGVALAGFVRFERSTAFPALDVRLFTENRVFALSNLAALINYSATFAVGFLLSLYLQYVRALTAQGAGTILLAQPVVQAVLSPVAGRLSDRVEPRLVASSGMALTVVGLAMLVPVGATTPLEYLLVALAVLGAGFGLFSSPNTNAVMTSVDRRRYGVAAAALGTMRLAGQMLSMGAAMLLISAFVGRVAITPQHHARLLDAFRVAFALFATLCVAGTFASLARGAPAAHPARKTER